MANAYTKKVKQRVRTFRSQGWSLGEISLKMEIPKNTISGWVKDIRLTQQQKERLKQKIIASGAIGRPLAIKANREKIEKWKKSIREQVRHFGTYAYKNPETGKLICGLLYLCEGAKYPSSRYLYFGNSDPNIVSAFLALLRKYYNIDEGKLRFDIAYRWDQDFEKLKNYWSKLTRIPKTKFFKTKPDKRTKGEPTLRKNYMGVGRIVYYSTSLQFELQAIGETIIKSGPYWIRLEPASNTHR